MAAANAARCSSSTTVEPGVAGVAVDDRGAAAHRRLMSDGEGREQDALIALAMAAIDARVAEGDVAGYTSSGAGGQPST
jgi:hypothetical protein